MALAWLAERLRRRLDSWVGNLVEARSLRALPAARLLATLTRVLYSPFTDQMMEAHYYLGVAHVDKREAERVLALLELWQPQVHNDWPVKARAFEERARAAASLGDSDKATRLLDQAESVRDEFSPANHSRHLDNLEMRARVARLLSDFAEAESFMRRLLSVREAAIATQARTASETGEWPYPASLAADTATLARLVHLQDRVQEAIALDSEAIALAGRHWNQNRCVCSCSALGQGANETVTSGPPSSTTSSCSSCAPNSPVQSWAKSRHGSNPSGHHFATSR